MNQTSLERKCPQCPLYSELTKTTFLLKSTNNTKININYHRLIGDECVWEGTSPMKAC